MKAIWNWFANLKIPTMPGGLTRVGSTVSWAWAWVAWAVISLARSIYNLWLSPKVWPAAITFFLVGWVMAFNIGQKIPERMRAYGLVGQPVAVKTVVDRGPLMACHDQRAQQAVELEIARKIVNEMQTKMTKLEADLAEKPKVVYRRAKAKDDPNVIKLRLPSFE